MRNDQLADARKRSRKRHAKARRAQAAKALKALRAYYRLGPVNRRSEAQRKRRAREALDRKLLS